MMCFYHFTLLLDILCITETAAEIIRILLASILGIWPRLCWLWNVSAKQRTVYYALLVIADLIMTNCFAVHFLWSGLTLTIQGW